MATVRGLAEIVLMVRDLHRSVHFYRDVLGLQLISPSELRGAAFLQVGNATDGVPQQVVLVQRPADSPDFPSQRAHRSVHHLGIEVARADFESEQKRLQGLGFEVRTGEHPFLPVQAFYLDDPDGNEVELVTKK